LPIPEQNFKIRYLEKAEKFTFIISYYIDNEFFRYKKGDKFLENISE